MSKRTFLQIEKNHNLSVVYTPGSCSLYTWIPDSATLINADPDPKLWVKNNVADPESGAFLTPGSGMGKKSGSGSGMKNPDHISAILETVFGLKYLNSLTRIRDPGDGKKSDPGSGIKTSRIRNSGLKKKKKKNGGPDSDPQRDPDPYL
jgi:hypothetical protein